MRVLVYPADRFGCGSFRMIWPAEALRRQGLDVTVIRQEERHLQVIMRGDEVVDMNLPGDFDVIVLQRVTHRNLVQAIPYLRRRGIAVVMDLDDDLAAIHPSNPAFRALHPKESHKPEHSWRHLMTAARQATFVTVTTPTLLRKYAVHGRGAVLSNYLPEQYYGIEHEDSDQIGWPASLHSHPNDPVAVGNALRRLEGDGIRIRTLGHPHGTGRAFGLQEDMIGSEPVPLQNWPAAVAELGIGIAPLADTKFNEGKSWLKPLEMSALGVPWVASPRTEYRRLHQLGCGVLAYKAVDWYRQLASLRSDPVRRKELSEAGREVAGTLRLEDHAWKWADAWSRAIELQKRSR